MKKLIALTLSIIASACILTGCGDGGTDGEVTDNSAETKITTSDSATTTTDESMGDKVKDDMDKAETEISDKLS